MPSGLNAQLAQFLELYQGIADGPGAGLFANGTAEAPSISFAADRDTGMRRAAGNTLALGTGGQDRITVSNAAVQIGVPVTGAAVTQSASDTTPGRLLRADHGYSRGNLVGAVTQSGGVPTGAAFGAGTNANGNWRRTADGILECWHTLTLARSSGSFCFANWSFPAVFSSAPVFMASVLGGAWDTDVPSGLARGSVTPVSGNLSATAVSAQLWAANGEAFAVGDAPRIQVMARGRWFEGA